MASRVAAERCEEGGVCLCVFCVGPLCGPPLRWWVLCGALPSLWVPCVGPLCGSPVWVPCVGPLCVGPLCGSPVWVPRRAAFHVASTRVMSPARSHAPALCGWSGGMPDSKGTDADN